MVATLELNINCEIQSHIIFSGGFPRNWEFTQEIINNGSQGIKPISFFETVIKIASLNLHRLE